MAQNPPDRMPQTVTPYLLYEDAAGALEWLTAPRTRRGTSGSSPSGCGKWLPRSGERPWLRDAAGPRCAAVDTGLDDADVAARPAYEAVGTRT